MIIAGPGGDRAFGGTGRDILIGGWGADYLVGHADEDLLVGGVTNYDDAGDETLRMLLDQWLAPNALADRMEVLRAGTGSYPGHRFDPGVTLFSDEEPDRLVGRDLHRLSVTRPSIGRSPPARCQRAIALRGNHASSASHFPSKP